MEVKAKRFWNDNDYFYYETLNGAVYKVDKDNVWPIDFRFGELEATDSETATIEITVRYNDVYS